MNVATAHIQMRRDAVQRRDTNDSGQTRLPTEREERDGLSRVGGREKEKVITAVVVIIDPAILSPSARHTKNNTDAHFRVH